jgi:uncharacterized damage-inducible protein DinB
MPVKVLLSVQIKKETNMSFSQSLLPEFDEEMKNTRRLLELVPDGKFAYQPHKKSMTLGQLASHIADNPSWTAVTLDVTELDIQPDHKPYAAKSRAELVAKFDEGVKEAREKIRAATDEQWAQTWTFKYAGQVMMSMPRSVVMRTIILNHMIHHRAQLGVYLRMNEIAIPGMYGPSADEANFTAQTAQTA